MIDDVCKCGETKATKKMVIDEFGWWYKILGTGNLSHITILTTQQEQPKPTYQPKKMKTAIVFALCIAAALAVPVDNTPNVSVLKDEKDVRVDGYKFG
jgi:hypothetical protein